VRARGGAVHQEHHRQVWRVRVRAHQDQLRSEERGRADQDYLSKGKTMFEIPSITKRTLLSYSTCCSKKLVKLNLNKPKATHFRQVDGKILS
jgi:hypothetical protein